MRAHTGKEQGAEEKQGSEGSIDSGEPQNGNEMNVRDSSSNRKIEEIVFLNDAQGGGGLQPKIETGPGADNPVSPVQGGFSSNLETEELLLLRSERNQQTRKQSFGEEGYS